MAPVKPKAKSLKQSRRNKAQSAIQKRWEALAGTVSEPRPTTSSTSKYPLIDVSTPKRPGCSKDLDKHANIRKSDLQFSESTIDEEVGIGLARDIPPEYLLVDSNALVGLVENLACPKCLQTGLVLQIKNKVGFKCNLVVVCEECQEEVVTMSSSKKTEKSGFDVNRKVTKAFINMSKGYFAIEQFSMIMNMSHLSKGLFQKTSGELHELSKATGKDFFVKARKRVRHFYLQNDPSVTDSTTLDLAVSFDCTWHKRGFTSNYGVGIVIHIDTGLVIDFCVLSKFCRNCAVTKAQLGDNSPEFHMWYEGHLDSCDINYTGSSPAMEVAAAEILWRRSIDFGFRYTTVVSDGDSKVFSHLKEIAVYGENVKLEKEECTNHVSKRLGTALRNVVSDTSKIEKVTLGGKAPGSLTGKTISKLTKYYQHAISENVNKDVDSMKSSILGTLYHCISTDANPKHFKCPQGEHSWCFYNRALANNETPGKHEKHIKTPINSTVLKYIVPIYKRLSERELLQRCLKGQTQNSNESLHSHIWRKCDKTRSASRRLVETAVADAVSEYNFGNIATVSSMVQASMSPGSQTTKIAKMRDRRRRDKIEKAKSARLKRRRLYLRKKNLQEEERRKNLEGDTYGPGQF